MGEVVFFPDRRTFPGAEVDYDFLDGFEWSPELLRDYAERARAAAARYGSHTPRERLPTSPPGRCHECQRTDLPRCRIERRLMCERCADPRLRVRDEVAALARGEHPLPAAGDLYPQAPIFLTAEGEAAWRKRKRGMKR